MGWHYPSLRSSPPLSISISLVLLILHWLHWWVRELQPGVVQGLLCCGPLPRVNGEEVAQEVQEALICIRHPVAQRTAFGQQQLKPAKVEQQQQKREVMLTTNFCTLASL
jgi:hypothetical protein